jgi:DNA replication and repair protein RecF
MYISHLNLQNFRNYKDLKNSFLKAGALFYGENGTGKTNVLEAIYFLCVGRSQRGASKRDMIHKDTDESYLEGLFCNTSDSLQTSISIGFSNNKKQVMKKNGKKVKLLSEIFLNNKIVSFSSHDSFLIYGDPLERRKYMDILLSQTDSGYFESLVNYKRNLVNRNKLLSTNYPDSSIDIYEEKMAEYGSYIFCSRKKLIDTISPLFSHYYSKIGTNTNIGAIKYSPSVYCDGESKNQWNELFFNMLKEKRRRDSALGFSSAGPHRDDFKCSLNGRAVKSFGSQGQCRSMALALRLCSLDYLEGIKQGTIIILVDDAFSELDERRTENIYSLLRNRGQLFLTALTRNNLLYKDLPVYCVRNNSVVSV